MDTGVDSQTPSGISPDEAAQRARRASELNFRTLYRDYRSKVYGTVHHVVGGSDEIDDIVQSVFLEIHRSLPRYKGQAKLSTWIYRISVNVALQYIRKRRRRRVFLFFKEDDHRLEGLSHEMGPRYENRELLQKLHGLMDKLSEKKRVVFTLHELEGLPLEEVADICEIPVNTVRSRLHAARTELLSRMKKAGMLEQQR